MAIRLGWRAPAGNLNSEAPKGPWGGTGGGPGGNGEDGGSGDSDRGGRGNGPRNPWAFPPEGRGGRVGAGPLDELLRRARGGGGGNGGGFGGLPGMPNGNRMWLLIVAALVVIWLGFTSIHAIGPRERGVVTLVGRYAYTLGPGIQFTLPEPFQSVQTINVGNIRTENFPASGENLMLTGDQNIVDLAYSVRWDIRSAPDFAFQLDNPQETVRATSESAMRAVIANTTLNEAIGDGRAKIEAQVQTAIQQVLDEYHAGIRIQGVSIQKAAAPSQVDEDFKQVTAAQQEAQANKNNANAYAQQILAAAQGEAAEFDKIYEQYKAAPEVTRRRLYYETMEQILARTNKVIVEAPGVTPYLPLQAMRRAAEPDAAQAQQAQQAQQGGQK